LTPTAAGMGRPRASIPEPECKRLIRARDKLAAAEREFRDAVSAAIAAGGSYSAVADVADVARSTVQKVVGSSPHA
jgi:hypothetical protein